LQAANLNSGRLAGWQAGWQAETGRQAAGQGSAIVSEFAGGLETAIRVESRRLVPSFFLDVGNSELRKLGKRLGPFLTRYFRAYFFFYLSLSLSLTLSPFRRPLSLDERVAHNVPGRLVAARRSDEKAEMWTER
jgi:hypothetical protein